MELSWSVLLSLHLSLHRKDDIVIIEFLILLFFLFSTKF